MFLVLLPATVVESDHDMPLNPTHWTLNKRSILLLDGQRQHIVKLHLEHTKIIKSPSKSNQCQQCTFISFDWHLINRWETGSELWYPVLKSDIFLTHPPRPALQ